jgi:hypothetical protein
MPLKPIISNSVPGLLIYVEEVVRLAAVTETRPTSEIVVLLVICQQSPYSGERGDSRLTISIC